MKPSGFLVAGGTGFIGTALCDALEREGRPVTVLTRFGRPGPGRRRYRAWAPDDPASAAAALAQEMESAAAVVDLSGESVVSGRWTAAVKRRILESRVRSARALAGAIERAGKKPELLVSASAVGYYGVRADSPAEESGPPGDGFLARVCRERELAARKAESFGVRVVLLRVGIALGAGGGILGRMLLPFKLGLGGPLGDGSQPMSWIHLEDLVRMILWLAERPGASGPVNATAPNPATNEEFSRTLARALGRPCLLRVPAPLLRLAAGEMAEMLLGGQRALPGAALAGGFKFHFPELEPALRDILGRPVART